MREGDEIENTRLSVAEEQNRSERRNSKLGSSNVYFFETMKKMRTSMQPKTPEKQASPSFSTASPYPHIQSSTINFFSSKFGKDPEEHLVETFSCALADNILLQGKLFISNKRLSFHSYFNRTTLFFGETKMTIPLNDVKAIEKRYNAIIFNNSLAVITAKGEIFFTSFVYRDRAYEYIKGVLKDYPAMTSENLGQAQEGRTTPQTEEENAIPLRKKPSREFGPWESPEQEVDKEAQEKELLKEMESRLTKIAAITPRDEELKSQSMNFVLSSKCDISDVFMLIFSDDQVTRGGKKFKTFWEYLRTDVGGDTKFTLTEWSPSPPEYFAKGVGSERKLLAAPLYSEREANFIHPVNSGGVPFMPKSCPVKEIHKIYWETSEKFFVDLEVRTSKIAYSDTFFLKIRYRFSRASDGLIHFAWRLGVIFEKDTILKKTIENQACSESKKTTEEHIFPAIDRFIKEALQDEEYLRRKRVFASEAYELKETPILADLEPLNKADELILRKEITQIGIEHITSLQSRLDQMEHTLKDLSRQNFELRDKFQTLFNMLKLILFILIAFIVFNWVTQKTSFAGLLG